MSRRSSLDIAADILRIALYGALKTRIVYGANLNFRMATDYLERLEKSGLLVRDGRIYRMTLKGRKYLERYRELRDLLDTGKNCSFSRPENHVHASLLFRKS